ncbi:hypothetical protein WJX74_009512 [Apatococcus lobatus]|uniref:Uncharacterized protein n=1 Tax=Apatococcus lobatus TaxID=904363 RepID=A0AAW1Q9H4_9CHLO
MKTFESAAIGVELEIGQQEAAANMADANGRAEEAHQLREEKMQLGIKAEQLRKVELIALRASGKQYHLKIQPRGQYQIAAAQAKLTSAWQAPSPRA